MLSNRSAFKYSLRSLSESQEVVARRNKLKFLLGQEQFSEEALRLKKLKSTEIIITSARIVTETSIHVLADTLESIEKLEEELLAQYDSAKSFPYALRNKRGRSN
jgi:hypothetical protein